MSKEITLTPTFSFAFIRSFGWIVFSISILLLTIYIEIQQLAVALILPVVVITYRIICWRSVKYEVSAHQIKYSRGVFQRQVDFMELYRVKDYDQKQSLIMKILGIMDVSLRTSDISHPVMEIRGIPVSNITDVIRELVEQARRENRVYAID